MLCIVAITARGELVFHVFADLAEFERGVTRGVKTGNTH